MKVYAIEGANVTVAQIAEALPHVPHACLRTRLRHGARSWVRLGAPSDFARSTRAESMRDRRKAIEELARRHVDAATADRLSLWANWRGPVSPTPLVWSVGVQIAPAGQGGPFGGALNA